MKMKKTLHLLGAMLLIASGSLTAYAQEKHEKGPWRKIQESAIPVAGTRYIKPTKYLTFGLDVDKIRTRLSAAKRIDDPGYVPVFIELPRPDGTFASYQVHENTTMHPDLAAAFPEIRAFDGVPVTNSGEIVKLDLTPQGFHAMILSPDKSTVYIDPYAFGGGDIEHYIVYYKADFVTDKNFACYFDAPPTDVSKLLGTEKSFGDCTKRTYRLALSATAEYTAFHGGTVALAQAAQVTTMNRVNGVYMREMAITMTLIANNNILIFTNAGSDPFTNGNPGSMITQNQNYVNANIGAANYDIGHVFGTNSGGLAGLGVVCSNSNKARGVTGSGAPIGDPFDIDYVAHEMGHQFDGSHTFRGSAGSCNGNANGATAMEPGSGSTIMAYAGICSPQDIQPNSDDYFHGISLEEIGSFITAAGHTCPVETAISPANTPPNITSTNGNVTIPASTPFALTAIATDPDGQVLTYCWEQMNNQNSTQPPVATSTGGPNFRSLDPSTSPTRYFPSIPSLMAGGPFTWEVIPSVNRTMNFRVVVRDNGAGGGCNDEANITLTTTTSAGPFVVNYPTAAGITWPGNSSQTVTWNVANTSAAPVSCANVDVMISTDGGATFTVIANNVPNDGSQVITVPNTSTTTAIVMVICENGTFFDVSNNVFAITAATNDYSLSLTNNSISACQGSNAVFSVQVSQIGSYTDPVTLSTSGLPGGVTANFSPNPATPGTSSTLTISNTAAAAPGTYPFTVNGTSTSGNHNTGGTLLISTNTSVVSTLTTPPNADPSTALPASLVWTNPNAGMSYDIEIATDAAFTNIVESATALSSPNYTATTLLPSTTYYWRVESYNSCSNAGNSTVFSFTTASCATYNSTNVPVNISASGTPTITSTLNVSASGTINDLNVVNLVGNHTWINDLTVTLTSPEGTSVVLWDDICGDAIEDWDIAFDDQAASATLPCPPTTGNTYQPLGSLADFNGEEMNGTWTLTIEDNFNQDGGALESWGLNICFTPSVPCNDPSVPTISGATSFCAGSSTTLSIGSGSLNDATDWEWYSGSCGGTSVGSGTSINVSAPGTYFVRGEGGCVTGGTCQSVTVTQTTVNTATTLFEGVLTANQNGATYQWVDCNNGNADVPGETAQNFVPAVNGSYAVEVTISGCTATSSCVAYNVVGLGELSDLNIVLYPNPTSGTITVDFGTETAIDYLNVTDVTGRLVREERAFTTSALSIDLSRESKGVYFLNVQSGSELQTLKITKQ